MFFFFRAVTKIFNRQQTTTYAVQTAVRPSPPSLTWLFDLPDVFLQKRWNLAHPNNSKTLHRHTQWAIQLRRRLEASIWHWYSYRVSHVDQPLRRTRILCHDEETKLVQVSRIELMLVVFITVIRTYQLLVAVTNDWSLQSHRFTVYIVIRALTVKLNRFKSAH